MAKSGILVEVAKKKLESDKMQEATNQTISWSKDNNLGINETKTKGMLISFGKDLDIPLLDMILDFSPYCSGICVPGVVRWAPKGTKPYS